MNSVDPWRNLCASLLYFVVSVRCRRQKKFTFAISLADELLVLANEHSRCAELDHIEHWANANNLTLNRQKSKEIIVTLSRRSKRAFNLPPCLSGIERVTSFKILRVTITDKLSISEHVRDVVLKCAQSLNVINMLRRHGMNDQALQAVSTVIPLNTYEPLACPSVKKSSSGGHAGV